MTNVKTDPFGIIKFLLLAVGLWPYQQSNFTRLQFIFLFSILTTFVIFQCTVFISHNCTTDLITKTLPFIFLNIMFVVVYYSFFGNVQTVKNLLEELLHVCNELKDVNEIAIINKYKFIAKRFTISLSVLCVCSAFFYICTSFSSDILNIILTTNLSESYDMIVMTEYFIDQEKYYYFILLHSIATGVIGAIVSNAIWALFLTYMQYTCGMFKIASYRIEHAMSMLENINQRHIFIHKTLIRAVNIHLHAMNLATDFLSSFETMMFCLLIFGVSSMSLNLFRIFQVVSLEGNLKECILPFIYAFAIVFFMFLFNYLGQTLTNHNNDIFTSAYNVKWYIAPLHIQRVILFILQRNFKNFTWNISGLFVGSMECFATLVKTSVSYFTVIYSIQ